MQVGRCARCLSSLSRASASASARGGGGGPAGPAGPLPLYPGHLRISPLQRVGVSVTAAIAAVCDPERDDMVAKLGEATGLVALRRMREEMRKSEVGKAILSERPLITQASVDASGLSKLEKGTLGAEYSTFMAKHGFSADSRRPVTLVDDEELAYVLTRYRQVHDMWHVLFDLPPTVEGEVALKWIELVQTGLPVAGLSALFGPFALHEVASRTRIRRTYMPWALRAGQRAEYLMNVYYEKEWAQTVTSLRERFEIEVAPALPE
jgi:ubiquinone biosynthesis protein COQ4